MADPRQDTYSEHPYWVAEWNVAAGAAAADYDGRGFIAPFACELIDVREVHQTAGSDTGAVTVMVKKVPSGTAKASGTDMLSAGLSLKTTADTPQSGSLTATLADRRLVEGDSVGLVTTGTLTAVDGVYIQAIFRIR